MTPPAIADNPDAPLIDALWRAPSFADDWPKGVVSLPNEGPANNSEVV